MKFIIPLLSVFLMLTSNSCAQYPENLRNAQLRVWLKSNFYDGSASIYGYDTSREQMFSFTDEVNGKIECIYSDYEQNSEFTTFLDPINTEHVVPQSYYGSSAPMRNDIHNIRPSHSSVNSSRSNKPFGEVPDNQATWHGLDGSGEYVTYGSEPFNSNQFSESSTDLFEPQEDSKGEIARQVFYFYTMYPTQAGSISNVANINTLYTWHLNDPVDAEETTRNNRIAQVQGNRNPYIDYPELVYDAWLWVEILGCTDSAATNYNATANTDDGSCIFSISGCTDPLANNYNNQANEDDGSCEYDPLTSFTGLSYEEVGSSEYGVTVRVYANLSDPTHQVLTLYGSQSEPLNISTTGTFYQDEEGGPQAGDINTADFTEFPSLNYDSWITIGVESSPSELNILAVDFNSFEQGGALVIDSEFGGGWYIFAETEPTAYPNAQGRVLIAQLTATDDISISVPIQTRNQNLTGFLDVGTLEIPIDFSPATCAHPLSYNFSELGLTDVVCDAFCIGDFNGDREVDVDDFLILQPFMNTSCE